MNPISNIQRLTLVVLTAVIGLLSNSAVAATQGDKDPSFNSGSNLKIILQAQTSSNPPPAVLGFGKNVLLNGTYVAVVNYMDNYDSNSTTQIVRITQDGLLDTTFNGTGQKNVLNSTLYHPTAAALDGVNNAIVVVGGNQVFSSTVIQVCRYEPDGTVDATLVGHNGVGCIDIPAATIHAANLVDVTSVAIQSDHKMVIAGSVVFVGTPGARYLFVLRLAADGSVDTAFGGSGSALSLGFGNATEATSVKIDSANKIVMTGFARNGTGSNTDIAVVRYNAQGFIDAECGVLSDICATTVALDRFGGLSDEGTAVAIEPTTGNVYVAGLAEAGYSATYQTSLFATAAVRLSSQFVLQGFPAANQFADFAEGNTLGYETDIAPSLVVDDQNRPLLIGGYTHVSAWRLTENGTTDSSYGSGGRVSVTTPQPPVGVGEYPRSQPRVFLDQDKPVIAVLTSVTGDPTKVQLSVARLLGDDSIFVDGFEQ